MTFAKITSGSFFAFFTIVIFFATIHYRSSYIIFLHLSIGRFLPRIPLPIFFFVFVIIKATPIFFSFQQLFFRAVFSAALIYIEFFAICSRTYVGNFTSIPFYWEFYWIFTRIGFVLRHLNISSGRKYSPKYFWNSKYVYLFMPTCAGFNYGINIW